MRKFKIISIFITLSLIIGVCGGVLSRYALASINVSSIISHAIPTININTTYKPWTLQEYAKAIIGFAIAPEGILSTQFGMLPTEFTIAHAQPEPTPTPLPEESKPVISLDMSPTSSEGYLNAGGVFVKNATTYTPDVSALLNSSFEWDIKADGPKVLITHSHSSESYKATAENFYYPSDPDRTQDPRYNVMRVGEVMTKTLNNMGIETIQDRVIHDYPEYNKSYKNDLATINKILADNPSIKVVIDVHRDSMQRSDGTRIKNVIDIDGKKTAQIMLVTGTDQMGLDAPNWQSSLQFAMKLQQQMNEMYPKLTRSIDLRQERFNTHVTLASIIMEVGSSANTLEEAEAGGVLAANALGELLNKMK
ncbi:MAG: stage II sporulation protein P [Clostridiales bacterium]|jgi:stage II sporulation protein P|nr:stage II sporulation protein P [Clostridiales bacterium]